MTAPLRSTICISPLPQQCLLPQERYLHISSLPQQCSLQQEPFPPSPLLHPPPPPQSKLPSDPLFTDDSNHPVTRFWFQKHLKAVLHLSDTPAGNFSSHSFRIGAATTAAHKGLSQQQIQELGRWLSEAFKSYIRSDRSHIKEAHQTLIGHPL